MQLKGIPLTPGKGRWPKNLHKRAMREYLLTAAGHYKQAMERRDGSSGAASPVRRINPATGEAIEGITGRSK